MMTMKIHLNKADGSKYACNPSFYQMPISKSVDVDEFNKLPEEQKCKRCAHKNKIS